MLEAQVSADCSGCEQEHRCRTNQDAVWWVGVDRYTCRTNQDAESDWLGGSRVAGATPIGAVEEQQRSKCVCGHPREEHSLEIHYGRNIRVLTITTQH